MSNHLTSFTQQLRWQHDRTGPVGWGLDSHTAQVSDFSWQDSMIGSEDSDWKRKVKQNIDATGPMTAERQTMQWGPANVSMTWYWPGEPAIPITETLTGVPTLRGLAGTYSWNAGDWLDVFTTADNKALVKLHKAIQAETTAFQGMTFLGELRETIQMIRRPAAALQDMLGRYCSDVVSNVRKVKRKPTWSKSRWLGEIRKTIGSTWLEYSFGLQPAMQDIKGLLSVFAHDNDDSRRSKARGHGYSEKAIGPVLADNPNFGGYMPAQIYRNVYLRCRIIYRAGLAWTGAAPFGTIDRLIELSGFRMREFVPTLYELIPYSWAVDYFSNLGEFIQCTATDMSSVRWANRTAIYERISLATGVLDTAHLGNPGTPYGGRASGSGLGYCQQYYRRVVRGTASLLYPTIELRMPRIDSAKWLNLGALLLQGRSSQEELRRLVRRG